MDPDPKRYGERITKEGLFHPLVSNRPPERGGGRKGKKKEKGNCGSRSPALPPASRSETVIPALVSGDDHDL